MISPAIRVALVGDHDPDVVAHRAIPIALQRASDASGIAVFAEWVPTEEITGVQRIAHYDALWCVPASPYRSTEGALWAIRFAREHGRPFLGTCGGFQHALLEYARNELGWSDAEHGETAPGGSRLVVSPLACSLVEVSGTVNFLEGTQLARAYESATGQRNAIEGYHCRYGLNVEFREALTSGPLRISAVDDAGDVCAVELDGHPFFVAMLFQPERAALAGIVPPVVDAFVRIASVHTRER